MPPSEPPADADPDGHAAFAAALMRADLPPPPAIGPAQARRFAVYRNNVAHGMIEALGASFPAVQRLVGEAFFAALARAYLAADPPRSPVLFHHGGGFGAFLDAFPPVAGVPYLGDVARLEWARLEAYHAADAEPAAIAALGAVAPERLADTRLVLHPSARLLRSRWPVYALWAASRDAGDPDAVDLAEAQAVLVHRPALEVETRHLAPGSAAFLAALAAGRPLGAAAEAAAAADPGFDLATDVAAELTGVFASGAIAGISPPAD